MTTVNFSNGNDQTEMTTQVTKELVLDYVKLKGPITSAEIAKSLNASAVFIEVFLSELSDEAQIRKTNFKINSLPLYFIPEQARKLPLFSRYLGEKDRCIFDRIFSEKMVAFSEVSQEEKNILENLSDFVTLQVLRINGTETSFFRWNFLSDEDAVAAVKQKLSGDKNSINNVNNAGTGGVMDKYGTPEESRNIAQAGESGDLNHSGKPATAFSAEQLSVYVEKYFHENNLTILRKRSEKKGRELEFEIQIPSQLGDVNYLCIVLTKSKVSDADVSKWYVQGQTNKLPVLLLYSGDLGKNTLKLTSNFINFKMKKIDLTGVNEMSNI